MTISQPYGGSLKELFVAPQELADEKRHAGTLASWDLTPRQQCDIELLMNGGFSPLEGFLTRQDYESVRDDMRLADGTLWPMPLTLDVSSEFAGKIEPGQELALRDQEGVILAVLEVADKWEPNLELEASAVFGQYQWLIIIFNRVALKNQFYSFHISVVDLQKILKNQ